jgi:hypothetical protein
MVDSQSSATLTQTMEHITNIAGRDVTQNTTVIGQQIVNMFQYYIVTETGLSSAAGFADDVVSTKRRTSLRLNTDSNRHKLMQTPSDSSARADLSAQGQSEEVLTGTNLHQYGTRHREGLDSVARSKSRPALFSCKECKQPISEERYHCPLCSRSSSYNLVCPFHFQNCSSNFLFYPQCRSCIAENQHPHDCNIYLPNGDNHIGTAICRACRLAVAPDENSVYFHCADCPISESWDLVSASQIKRY